MPQTVKLERGRVALEVDGNRCAAARVVGIGRIVLRRPVERFGLDAKE